MAEASSPGLPKASGHLVVEILFVLKLHIEEKGLDIQIFLG